MFQKKLFFILYFSFSTLNNTAISPGDFAKITTGQFTFNSGEDSGATRQISVGINDDEVVESSEYFRVKLEAVTADTIGSNGTANVTITDNDSK